MRRRHQKGSLRKVNGSWLIQWWEDGHRRKRTLGRVSQITKTEAQNALAAILTPINNQQSAPSEKWTLGDFVAKVYLPFYRRKWKPSTVETNGDRLKHHLTSEFANWTLNMFTRDNLQDFLDRKVAAGLSFSTVAHLRWDLSQIFRMAVAEGYLQKNPAALLFTSREAHRPPKRRMTAGEVKLLLSVLELRELLISKLAIIAGMRPGEIFGLKWKHVKQDHIDIQQRVYRGKVDTPKTVRSVRGAALSQGLQSLIPTWKSVSIKTDPEAWVFPSERLTTPLSRDNCWRRCIKPKLEPIGLGWVNFQVMRRTHSSLMRDNNVDSKVVADQLGHSLDVNLNVYTQTDLDIRRQAVNVLESAVEQNAPIGDVSARVM